MPSMPPEVFNKEVSTPPWEFRCHKVKMITLPAVAIYLRCGGQVALQPGSWLPSIVSFDGTGNGERYDRVGGVERS